MFAETSIAAIMTSATTATARREAKTPRKRTEGSISLGLFEVDQDRVGAEEGHDDREEIEHIAQVDDAARDRAEMAEKAHLRGTANQPLRGPALEHAEQHRRSRDG